jgi:hypothetical protein
MFACISFIYLDDSSDPGEASKFACAPEPSDPVASCFSAASDEREAILDLDLETLAVATQPASSHPS